MTAPEIFFLCGFWVVIAACLTPVWADEQLEPHNVVFWPIALFKWLMRQLYLVLFTGWKQ